MPNTDNSLPFELLVIVITTHPQPITNSPSQIAPFILVYAELMRSNQESSYVH
jgi:hypothetical protein